MKRKAKKKSLNLKIILALIILIIIIALIIKLGIKNIFKQEKVEENISQEQIIENKENEEQVANQEAKEDSKFKKENSTASSKQQIIKKERLDSNKTLGTEGLPVLMYHFFYDESKGETGQDDNWLEVSQFEEQIKYLSENDFYYPTWEEVEEYIDGKIKLPEKSVVITVDDGDPSFFELGVPILQKYDAFATSFVVAYWYGDVINDKQKNISYQSHSYDMHKAGSGGKGVMLSWSYDKIKEDMELSSKSLDGANIFCYPFGQYIESNFKVLKDTGYKLAFTTAGR